MYYLQHFYWPSASQYYFYLRCQETNASCSKKRKKESSYTARNHPWKSLLSSRTSRLKQRRLKKTFKFWNRTCTKLLWVLILAYQDPLKIFCLLCFNLIQSLSGSLSREWSTLGSAHTQSGSQTDRTRNRRNCLSWMALEITTQSSNT